MFPDWKSKSKRSLVSYYLYCFIAPTHYLTSSNVCNRCWHFAPLIPMKNKHWINAGFFQMNDNFETNKIKWNRINKYLEHDILWYSAVSVDVNAFIIVTQKQLHTIRIWQCHNTVWYYWTLSLKFHNCYQVRQRYQRHDLNKIVQLTCFGR